MRLRHAIVVLLVLAAAPASAWQRADYAGLKLLGATLGAEVLAGARLCNTTLPDGTVSNRDCQPGVPDEGDKEDPPDAPLEPEPGP